MNNRGEGRRRLRRLRRRRRRRKRRQYGEAEFYSHVQIWAITEEIFVMNSRGISRVMNKKEEVEENKCNNYFISDS